tara:strand:+ start:2528 stop:2920 length:393 start_codon:yes stop_codon:yes gene_type:complete
MLKYLFFLLLAIVSNSFKINAPVETYTISIQIINIRNSKGTMQLYRSQKIFAAETPYKTYRISKQNISDKILFYKIKGIFPGDYGIALLDNENGNKKWITDGYTLKRDSDFQTIIIQDGLNQLSMNLTLI